MPLTDDQLTALAIGGAVIGVAWLVTAAMRLLIRAEVNRMLRGWVLTGAVTPRDKRGRFKAR